MSHSRFQKKSKRHLPTPIWRSAFQRDLSAWVARAGVNTSPHRVNLFWGRFRLVLIITGHRNHQMGVVCPRKHHVGRTGVEVGGKMGQ